MVKYECPRCGYTTEKKTNMTNHVNRKNMCKPVLNDNNLNLYIQKLLENPKICKNCNKEFSRTDNKKRHDKICKYNETKRIKVKELKESQNLNIKDKQIAKLSKQLENSRLLCNTSKEKIRSQSRNKYKKSGLPLKCLYCNYSKHVHISHIKEIKDFGLGDKVTDINKLSNLVALCSNCHFEMDKLKNPEIIRKVKLHSLLIYLKTK
jgi:hypothetical protein